MTRRPVADKILSALLTFLLLSGVAGCNGAADTPIATPAIDATPEPTSEPAPADNPGPNGDLTIGFQFDSDDVPSGIIDMKGFECSRWGDSVEQVIANELAREPAIPDLSAIFTFDTFTYLAGLPFNVHYTFAREGETGTKLIEGKYTSDIYLDPQYNYGMERAVRDFEDLRGYFTELYGDYSSFTMTYSRTEQVETDNLDDFLESEAAYAYVVWTGENRGLVAMSLYHRGELCIIFNAGQDIRFNPQSEAP